MLPHCIEVRGEVLPPQHGALKQLVIRMLQQVSAAQCAALVDQRPHANALHTKCMRGDLRQRYPYIA
jgi:hypothetical protein